MKILFDFISIQGYINGGAEYTKRILKELDGIKNEKRLKLVALYDSKEKFINDDRHLFDKCFQEWIDVRAIKSIGTYCKDANVDVFFIGIGQRLMRYYLTDIECRTIVVIHDLDFVELSNSPVIIRQRIPTNWTILKQRIKNILLSLHLKKQTLSGQDLDSFERQKEFLLKENTEIVTVSRFSKISILYNIPFLQTKNISVFYSPLRQIAEEKEVEKVKKLVTNDIPYFVCLNSKRVEKNVKLAVDVVRIFNRNHPEYHIVTTGGMQSLYENHIGLGFVSNGELSYILKHASALIYPTFIEGFGYPPIEAMYHGVPVIASMTTSIPEIIGENAIYFNPMFGSELYNALLTYINMDKKVLCEMSLSQYERVAAKQHDDLNQFIKKIIDDR